MSIEFGVRFDDKWKVGAAAAAVVGEGSVMIKMGAGVSTKANCPFTYGMQVGAKLYAQAEAPTIFKWPGVRYDITGWEKNVIEGGTCPGLGNMPTKRSPTLGLPWGVESNITSEPVEYYSIDESSKATEYHSLEKRSGVYGPAFRIPVGNFFCPSSETGEDQGTDCSTTEPAWDDDEYLTLHDEYGNLAPRELDFLEWYNVSNSLEPRAFLEKRGLKESTLCGIGIQSSHPGGGELPVSEYSFLASPLQHCSISLLYKVSSAAPRTDNGPFS